jgi:hypothetical protein
MSTTSDAPITYTINCDLGQNADSNCSIFMSSADGFTDAIVAAVFAAVAGVTSWPSAVTPGGNLTVTKATQAYTSYATDYASSPVSFS